MQGNNWLSETEVSWDLFYSKSTSESTDLQRWGRRAKGNKQLRLPKFLPTLAPFRIAKAGTYHAG
jgi:hypothetical protein